jgi:hypothetical protein
MQWVSVLAAVVKASLFKRHCKPHVRKSYVLARLMTVELDIIDSCPEWEGLLSRLTTAANSFDIPKATVDFHPGDVVTQFAQYTDLFRKTDLVTMMFTLNELVAAQGKVAATKFLINLVKTIPRGALILVYLNQNCSDG